jgi:hypothetical protein
MKTLQDSRYVVCLAVETSRWIKLEFRLRAALLDATHNRTRALDRGIAERRQSIEAGQIRDYRRGRPTRGPAKRSRFARLETQASLDDRQSSDH